VAELVLRVAVDAPAEVTWAAAVDWAGQGEWMLGTRVRPTVQDGRGVGAQLIAFSGVGRFGFNDTMTITAWDPPHRCEVRHTGRVVRGAGAFEVVPLPGDRSEFVWSEWLALPLGMAGQLAWPLLRPVFAAGVLASLHRFASWAPSHPARMATRPAQR
jgi:hypothetical protein